MALYKANTQEGGYCYQCRNDAPQEALKQCIRCKNWFCLQHITSREDIESIIIKLIDVCSPCGGSPRLL